MHDLNALGFIKFDRDSEEQLPVNLKTISKRQRKVKGPVQIKGDLDIEANRWWA